MLSVKATWIGCAKSWRQNSGLDKDQTETDAKVVEEADGKEAAAPASQAQTPIPMPATTPGSTATTSKAVGQELEMISSQQQSPKSSTSRKRKKKTTTSTPRARLARALGPSSQGSVAFGSDVPRRRSQRAKK